jgi:hypothetical protein
MKMDQISAQNKYLRKIDYIANGVYSVYVGTVDDVSTINSFCKVHDGVVRHIEYVSQEFNEEIMRGNIMIKPISHAISAFHDAVTRR